jgi:hypothetical protein
MKITFAPLLAVAALSLSACDTGNVQVTNQSGIGSNSLPPLNPSALVGNSAAGTSVSVSAQAMLARVYFESVLTRDGTPDSVIGLNYLDAASSEKSAAGGFEFSSPVGFNPEFNYFPSTQNLGYLGINADFAQVLMSDASTSSLPDSSKTVYAFPTRVESYALDAARSTLVFLEAGGSVRTLDLNATSAQPSSALDLQGERATHIDLSLDGKRLLILTEENALVFKSANSSFQLEQKILGVARAAFGSDGKQLAYVDLASGNLHLMNIGDSSAISSLKLESPEVYDLSIRGEKILYWVRLPQGTSEVRFVAIAAGQVSGPEQKVASLNVSQATQSGVVCPTEVQGSIYFSDFSNESYVIKKFAETTQAISSFQGSGYDEGYICPKAVVQP